MRRLLLLAGAIVFVDTLFYAAITPLLPRFSDEFGLSKAAAGVLAGSYAAGTFVGALPGGVMAARLGVRPTVLIGLGLMSGASIAFAFAPSVAVLDGARLIQGIGGAFSWAGALGWLIDAAPSGRRGELIGSAMAAAIAGSLLGPVLGAVADALGPEAVFSSVAMVGAALATWALRTPAAVPSRAARLRDLAAASADGRIGAGMWLVALPGLLFGALNVLAPLELAALGAGAFAIAAVFVTAGLLEATVNPLVGRLADRRGTLGPALAGLAAAALVFALLPLAGSVVALCVLVVLAGPAVGTLWTPSITLVSDRAEALGIEQGFVFAIMNLAWAVGQSSGSAGGARLADAAGDWLAYLLLAVLTATTLIALWRAARRSSLTFAAPNPG